MNAVRSENRARVMALIIAASVVAACGGTDEGPEAAIRAWVAEGQQAAESKDRGALIDMVAGKLLAGEISATLRGEIAAQLDFDRDVIESVEIAGPEFINFRAATGWWTS